jgi:hypothetical protein
MVTVATTPNPFEARVIAARLGAEGMVWELRGPVDGPYPVGQVDVLVGADDYDAARELLLADEVEWAFEESDDEPAAPGRARWFGVAALVLVAVFALGRMTLHLF